MVKSYYEWIGPFKYQTNGEAFWYKGKMYRTKNGMRVSPTCLIDPVYENDELYARWIRRVTKAEIFDTLPDGWHLGIHEYGGRRGIYGRNDSDSAYEWCETDEPMFIRIGGYERHNPKYQQALVRRTA